MGQNRSSFIFPIFRVSELYVTSTLRKQCCSVQSEEFLDALLHQSALPNSSGCPHGKEKMPGCFTHPSEIP